MRRRGWLRALASAVLLATAPACASTARTAVPAGTGATVRVDNQAFLDVNVYALRGTQRIRLGTVIAHTTSTFRVPAVLVGSGVGVRFIIDFIGSDRAPVSEEITIWPGEEVNLTIPAA